MPAGRLALYMLALEATCHNTADFHGNDLPEILEHNMKHFPTEGFNNHFQYALGVLALCQSGSGAVKLRFVRQLMAGQRDDGCYRFDGDDHGPDVSSLSLMAMSCAADTVPEGYQSLFENKFNQTRSCILSRQQEDGSFGNEISTALASQALIAASVDPAVWRAEEAIQRVVESQHADGHFGNLGATMQILPLLARRHLGSVKEIKAACTINDAKLVDTQTDNEPPSPTAEPGPPITINLIIENGVDESQAVVMLQVTAPAGSTLFQFMQEALQSSQGLFTFESKMTDFGNFITSINGLSSDAVNHRYWSMLYGPDRKYAETGPDGIVPSEDNVDYIFHYKSY